MLWFHWVMQSCGEVELEQLIYKGPYDKVHHVADRDDADWAVVAIYQR